MKYFIDTEFLEGTQKESFPISLFRKETAKTIDLISIGIVAEDGREYYAISKDFNLEEAWNRFDLKLHSGDRRNQGDGTYKVYWLRDNVLKPIWIDLFLNYEAEFSFLKGKAFDDFEQELKNGEHDKLFTFKSLKALINRYGKTNKEISKEIIDFTILKNQLDNEVIINSSDINYPEFYAYFADYDWVAFCWLFGKMMDLPKGFPMYCKDLKQILDEKVKSYLSDEYSKKFHVVPTDNLEERLYVIKKEYGFPKQENEHSAIHDARWNKKLYDFINKL